jgi:hypothetical protein
MARLKPKQKEAEWTPTRSGELMPFSLYARARTTQVIWIEAGDALLTEPFFAQTVSRLRAMTPPARCWATDLEWLLASAQIPAGATPGGFVFHVSRCGSTLVSNALKVGSGSVVVSEALPITQLSTVRAPRLPPYSPRSWNGIRKLALAALFASFARRAPRPGARLIVKFTSVNLSAIDFFRATWPEVPCLIVVRDPLEVIVSNLSVPSSWARLQGDREALLSHLGWRRPLAAGMEREAYCAKVVGFLCAKAASVAGRRCRLLDYEQIGVDALCNVRRFFGLETSAKDERELAIVCKSYSKDSTGRARHEEDRAEKRLLASDRLRFAVDAFAAEPYRRARARALSRVDDGGWSRG